MSKTYFNEKEVKAVYYKGKKWSLKLDKSNNNIVCIPVAEDKKDKEINVDGARL